MGLTMLSPWLVLGRNITYASSVIDGDIDTAAKLSMLNAVLATAKTFVFDRAYNITAARADLPETLFTLPVTLQRLEGSPHLPIDMSMMENSGTPKYMVRQEGTAGTAVPLFADPIADADLSPGMDVVRVGAVGIATLALVPGDRVWLYSDKLFTPGGTVGAEEQGEITTVVSVSATSFTVSPPVQDDYLVNDTASVAKLSMPQGLVIQGLRGIGPGQFATDTIGDRLLHIIWSERLVLDAVVQEYMDNGSYVYSCPGGRNLGWKSIQQHPGSRTANSYGFAMVNACHDFRVEGWHCTGGKHAIVQTESATARGGTRRVTICDGFASGQANYAIATHSNCEDIGIFSNRINGANGGIDAGGRGIKTGDNDVRFLPDANIGVGISVSEVPTDFLSSGDRVYGGRFALRVNTTSTPPLSGVPGQIRVRDFYAEGFSQAGLMFSTALSGAADIFLRGIETYLAGNAPTGVTQAKSIRIEGDFTDVVLDGAILQAAAGNVSYAINTSGITNGRFRNIDYSGHSAPTLAGTDVTSANVGAF